VLRFVLVDWLQPVGAVPHRVGSDPEELAVYRRVKAYGAWRDARGKWAAENGWTTRELYPLREEKDHGTL
jgi:hypothetical protein